MQAPKFIFRDNKNLNLNPLNNNVNNNKSNNNNITLFSSSKINATAFDSKKASDDARSDVLRLKENIKIVNTDKDIFLYYK